MNTVVNGLWEDVLSILKPEMNDESYDLWLRPIQPLSLDHSHLVLQVPNAFFADWLRDHYQSRIEALLKEHSGREIALSFQVVHPGDGISVPVAAAVPAVTVPPVPAVAPVETYLNPRYTFDTFVVGHSNRFAQAASQAV